MKNTDHYTVMILEAIQEMIEENGLIEEFKEGNNLTDFVHSFANLAPSVFYTRATGCEVDSLEFNHIANKLVFQSLKKDK